ncbi:uncharacterized protein YukE [Sinomonas atrocyanea]|uniref:WXG100 family type VII secretion target n=1 Tax=Sinomonas atrocyanea TaxID=37927 RepID=UPI002787592F|nr:WXG100 family type VII secretion target [Sinomonas atrocyanea]MDP9884727.1 uncharacterized protein YukE [Sinomonas atrocyanea]
MAIQQGANPEELRALGKQFALRSTSIRNAQRSIDQLASRLSNVWAGSDADEFTRQWAQIHRPGFIKLAADLGEGARTLAANADAQERTSAELDGRSPGGGPEGPGPSVPAPVGAGSPSNLPGVPDWLEDKHSPFRTAWSTWSLIKAFPKLRAGLFDLGAMAKVFGVGALNPFSSSARLAWSLARPQNWPDELLTTGLSRAFNASSDAVSGNWHKVLGLAEDAKAFKAFNVATKGLGLFGAGLDGLSAINKFRDGNIDGGIASSIKAGLGVATVFAPPPANVIAGVITAGWSLYDNVPAVKNVVDGAASAVAHGAEAVGSAVADGAEAVGGAVADGAKSVAHFFGF